MTRKEDKPIRVTDAQEQYLRAKAEKFGNHRLAKKFNKHFDSDLSHKDVAQLRDRLGLSLSPKQRREGRVDPRAAFVAEHAALDNKELARRLEEKFAIKTKPNDVEGLREKPSRNRRDFIRAMQETAQGEAQKPEPSESMTGMKLPRVRIIKRQP